MNRSDCSFCAEPQRYYPAINGLHQCKDDANDYRVCGASEPELDICIGGRSRRDGQLAMLNMLYNIFQEKGGD